VVSFNLNPNGSAYLSVSGDTATVDFNGSTSTTGTAWVLIATVQSGNYVTTSDPFSTYSQNINAYDPCADADALTIDTTYIATLATTYDLFSPVLDYTWAPTSVATYDSSLISEANCGALTVTLSSVSGPSDVWTVTGTNTYYIFGSDPADAAQTLTL
jgi:hypothetical protein